MVGPTHQQLGCRLSMKICSISSAAGKQVPSVHCAAHLMHRSCPRQRQCQSQVSPTGSWRTQPGCLRQHGWWRLSSLSRGAHTNSPQQLLQATVWLPSKGRQPQESRQPVSSCSALPTQEGAQPGPKDVSEGGHRQPRVQAACSRGGGEGRAGASGYAAAGTSGCPHASLTAGEQQQPLPTQHGGAPLSFLGRLPQ